jgi:histidine triad (HIT) family protein
MCVFCKIVNGEIPSYKIYETDNVMAFLDISQNTKGHTLVIPKKTY